LLLYSLEHPETDKGGRRRGREGGDGTPLSRRCPPLPGKKRGCGKKKKKTCRQGGKRVVDDKMGVHKDFSFRGKKCQGLVIREKLGRGKNVVEKAIKRSKTFSSRKEAPGDCRGGEKAMTTEERGGELLFSREFDTFLQKRPLRVRRGKAEKGSETKGVPLLSS